VNLRLPRHRDENHHQQFGAVCGNDRIVLSKIYKMVTGDRRYLSSEEEIGAVMGSHNKPEIRRSRSMSGEVISSGSMPIWFSINNHTKKEAGLHWNMWVYSFKFFDCGFTGAMSVIVTMGVPDESSSSSLWPDLVVHPSFHTMVFLLWRFRRKRKIVS